MGVNCDWCKKQVQNSEQSDGVSIFCSLNCRVNWNFRKINSTFENHKTEIEKFMKVQKSNNNGLFFLSVGLLVAVGFLGLTTMLLHFENEEQNERLLRFGNYQAEIQTHNTENINKICLQFEKLGYDMTCKIDKNLFHFEMDNP